jgi:hypothetical protein
VLYKKLFLPLQLSAQLYQCTFPRLHLLLNQWEKNFSLAIEAVIAKKNFFRRIAHMPTQKWMRSLSSLSVV